MQWHGSYGCGQCFISEQSLCVAGGSTTARAGNRQNLTQTANILDSKSNPNVIRGAPARHFLS